MDFILMLLCLICLFLSIRIIFDKDFPFNPKDRVNVVMILFVVSLVFGYASYHMVSKAYTTPKDDMINSSVISNNEYNGILTKRYISCYRLPYNMYRVCDDDVVKKFKMKELEEIK